MMCSAPATPPSSDPPQGLAARGAHSVSWRSLRVLRNGNEVQARVRLRILRHLREHGFIPDGYTIEPKWSVIDFLGFEVGDDSDR